MLHSIFLPTACRATFRWRIYNDACVYMTATLSERRMKMDTNVFCSKTLHFLAIIMLKKMYNFVHFHLSSNFNASQPKFHKNPSFEQEKEGYADETIVFHMEGALLKSSSLSSFFTYFMVVAFEAGGPFRALILLLMYPFVCLVGGELGMKIMVFVCFVGIKERSFKVGRGVLPKFMLEEVGEEGFDVVMRYGRKIGVSGFPRVMVDGFLRDCLGVDVVVGRELKVVFGYFVGLMEGSHVLNEIVMGEKMGYVVGFGCASKFLHQPWVSHCKAMYPLTEDEKRNWKTLPRQKYPKPLIFHDGRLAFRPTPLAALSALTWAPFGILLAVIRTLVCFLLPYNLAIPAFYFLGMHGTLSPSHSHNTLKRPRGTLYVCNHRTLMDPIYLSAVLMKPLTALTYSLSKVSEMVSPIKTARLTRNRAKDSEIMERLLREGDVVIFPEGTTCREPYLLRFSPMFVEKNDEIVLVAIHTRVGMFYGTTAGGCKSLDPVLFLMNPLITCDIKIVEKVGGVLKDGESEFKVANDVQARIGEALGYECTRLTRKHKYMMLAGNEGVI